jgi:hypothetical protein
MCDKGWYFMTDWNARKARRLRRLYATATYLEQPSVDDQTEEDVDDQTEEDDRLTAEAIDMIDDALVEEIVDQEESKDDCGSEVESQESLDRSNLSPGRWWHDLPGIMGTSDMAQFALEVAESDILKGSVEGILLTTAAAACKFLQGNSKCN